MTESRGSLASAPALPFGSARLDGLLNEARIDALVISSKHNIQYLFGGHRFFFFDHFDAIGAASHLRDRERTKSPFLAHPRQRNWTVCCRLGVESRQEAAQPRTFVWRVPIGQSCLSTLGHVGPFGHWSEWQFW
jgi:Xaa-Pro aminopeptidase